MLFDTETVILDLQYHVLALRTNKAISATLSFIYFTQNEILQITQAKTTFTILKTKVQVIPLAEIDFCYHFSLLLRN